MTIEIKRNCSSSIRKTADKITFGDFTIVLDKISAKHYLAIKEKYEGMGDTELLKWIIATGLSYEIEHEEVVE